MHHRRTAAGYSLAEILVVVAIIGVLSLITVPAFMNFQRAAVFKSAMRIFSTDLRAARSKAIRESYDVRVELSTGAEGPTTKEYRAFSATDGATWVPLKVQAAFGGRADNSPNGSFVKILDGPVWLESSTNLPDLPVGSENGRPDIVFHPNGTVDIFDGAGIAQPAAVVVLATNFQNIFSNRYNITITRSGQIRASTAQCNDGIDNDADGLIDYGGLGTSGPDPQCSSSTDNSES